MSFITSSIIGGIQGLERRAQRSECAPEGLRTGRNNRHQRSKPSQPEDHRHRGDGRPGSHDMGRGRSWDGSNHRGGNGRRRRDLRGGYPHRLPQPLHSTAGSTAAAGLTGCVSALHSASMMSQYSPAYQFQLQQGQQAAARQASAMGVTGSGGTAKALQQYAQNYAGTAFTNASNLYSQNFQRLLSTAQLGEGAATTAGQAGLQAAEYGGTLNENAAQYAGTAGMQGAEYAGNADINAENLTAQNTLSGAGYLANTQIGAQQALAQGDLGAASAWNGMLGGIGSAANTLAFGGLGTNASGGLSWSPSNLATNLWGGGSGGGGGNPYANSPGSNTWTPYGPIAPPQTRIPAGG